jgi:hypothetical protein
LGAQINHGLGHTNLESHGRGNGEAHILDDAFVTSNLAQGGLADPSAAQGAPPQAPPLLRMWTVVRASHPWPTTAHVEEGWRGRQRHARRPTSDAMAGLAWRRTGRPATALVEKGGDLRACRRPK